MRKKNCVELVKKTKKNFLKKALLYCLALENLIFKSFILQNWFEVVLAELIVKYLNILFYYISFYLSLAISFFSSHFIARIFKMAILCFWKSRVNLLILKPIFFFNLQLKFYKKLKFFYLCLISLLIVLIVFFINFWWFSI